MDFESITMIFNSKKLSLDMIRMSWNILKDEKKDNKQNSFYLPEHVYAKKVHEMIKVAPGSISVFVATIEYYIKIIFF